MSMMSCLVCETEAHGQHFGIRCCRACAAFFRRTLTMNLRYKCRFERKCEVSFNKRYSCRCCRFEKCIRMGMRKDMVQSKSEIEKDSSGTETDSIGHSPYSSVESGYTFYPPQERNVPVPKFPNDVADSYQPNSDLHQPNISFHRSVIEEVGRAVMPTTQHGQFNQNFEYSYTDLSSTDEQSMMSQPSSSNALAVPSTIQQPQNVNQHLNMDLNHGQSHIHNLGDTQNPSQNLIQSQNPNPNQIQSQSQSQNPNQNQNQMFAMAAQQATHDLHENVHTVLTPTIDALFGQPADMFCHMPDIPLTLCQQALLAYREHNRQWPNQDSLIENVPLDMEVFMRNHYVEIEHIARFCMSIRVFAQLPKDQKWIIFKHFWTRFYELDRCFATCLRLGFNLNDERGLTLNGQIVNYGISVVKLENISDMDANQVKNFLKGSMDKFRLIFINPFKKLQPTEYELMYMMMSIMWSVSNLPGITDSTRDIAEKVELRLAEDLHTYYSEQYDNNNPNYAGRITRLSSIASAVDEITERKREDCQVSKTFNIFKNDFFFSDLTDFPV